MAYSVAFWDRLADSYDSQVHKKYADAYRDTIALSEKYLEPEFRALDFACGSGITTISLARRVKKIHAIDTSRKMIARAREKAAGEHAENIEFAIADIFNPYLDAMTFDAVLAYNVLHFMKDTEKALARIRNVLTANGVFISVTDCLGENKTLKTRVFSALSLLGVVPRMKLFTMDGLETIIKRQGFTLLEQQNLYTIPPNYFIAAKKSESAVSGAGSA